MYGMGMGMGMNTGMLSPYGMAATNPYAYTGMVCFSDTHYKEVLIQQLIAELMGWQYGIGF